MEMIGKSRGRIVSALAITAMISGCATMGPDESVSDRIDFTSYQKIQAWDIAAAPRAAAFAPDGSFVLVTFSGGTPNDTAITRFDIGNDSPSKIVIALPRQVSGEAKSLAIAPEGDEFAASWPGALLIMDAETLEQRQTVNHRQGHELLYFNDLAWSPDGSRLVGISGKISWINTESGRFIAETALPRGGGRKLSALDSDTVLAGTSGGTRLIKANQSEAVCEFDYPSPGDVAISDDGWKLAVAYRGGISVRRTADCSEISNWTTEGFVPTIAWLPDGQHLAASTTKGTVTFWDTQSGSLVHALQAYADGLVTLALSADGRTLMTVQLTGEDKQLKVWGVR